MTGIASQRASGASIELARDLYPAPAYVRRRACLLAPLLLSLVNPGALAAADDPFRTVVAPFL